MESKVLEKIVSDILVYQEDNESFILTKDAIKSIIEGNIEELTKEVEEEIYKY